MGRVKEAWEEVGGGERTDRQGGEGVSEKDRGDGREDRRSEVRRGERRQLEERRQVGVSHNQTSTSLCSGPLKHLGK